VGVFGAPVNNGALSFNAFPVMVDPPEGGWEVHRRVFPGARAPADRDHQPPPQRPARPAPGAPPTNVITRLGEAACRAPILRQASLPETITVPWWGGRTLRYQYD